MFRETLRGLKMLRRHWRCMCEGHKPILLTTFLDGHNALVFEDESQREMVDTRLCRNCGVLYWDAGKDVPCSTAEEIERFNLENSLSGMKLRAMEGKRNGEVE